MRLSPQRLAALLLAFVAAALLGAPAFAEASGSLGDHGVSLPSLEELWRVVSLRDYNTRVVVLGTAMLGAAAGLAGVFLTLRKRALLSDAVSHATLPGVALAFMVMTASGGDGKNLFGLLVGAAIAGALGMLSAGAIERYTRLKGDAALGISMSVYFGLGVALLKLAERMPGGNAAGLASFIYGKTASMLFWDAVAIGVVALLCALCCVAFFKEFAIVSFDDDFARSQGWPVGLLDALMMGLVVVVTVIGLQAVGLILVVALLVIPPAAARFWTRDLRTMALASAIIGAASGLFGSALSALMANLPAGAVIVLVAAAAFLASLLFGKERGAIKLWLQRLSVERKVARQHLLRAMAELAEARRVDRSRSIGELMRLRSWSERGLRAAIRRAIGDGLMRPDELPDRFALTEAGEKEAARATRNHRLWELYLIHRADIAPSHVDRDADAIEHVLDAEMIRRLEARLAETLADRAPLSPHALADAATPAPAPDAATNGGST